MNPESTVIALMIADVAILLTGTGKIQRALAAASGPASGNDKAAATDGANVLRGVIGLGVAGIIVVALAGTPLYPAVLAALLMALLYLLLSKGGLNAIAALDHLILGSINHA